MICTCMGFGFLESETQLFIYLCSFYDWMNYIIIACKDSTRRCNAIKELDIAMYNRTQLSSLKSGVL